MDFTETSLKNFTSLASIMRTYAPIFCAPVKELGNIRRFALIQFHWNENAAHHVEDEKFHPLRRRKKSRANIGGIEGRETTNDINQAALRATVVLLKKNDTGPIVHDIAVEGTEKLTQRIATLGNRGEFGEKTLVVNHGHKNTSIEESSPPIKVLANRSVQDLVLSIPRPVVLLSLDESYSCAELKETASKAPRTNKKSIERTIPNISLGSKCSRTRIFLCNFTIELVCLRGPILLSSSPHSTKAVRTRSDLKIRRRWRCRVVISSCLDLHSVSQSKFYMTPTTCSEVKDGEQSSNKNHVAIRRQWHIADGPTLLALDVRNIRRRRKQKSINATVHVWMLKSISLDQSAGDTLVGEVENMRVVRKKWKHTRKLAVDKRGEGIIEHSSQYIHSDCNVSLYSSDQDQNQSNSVWEYFSMNIPLRASTDFELSGYNFDVLHFYPEDKEYNFDKNLNADFLKYHCKIESKNTCDENICATVFAPNSILPLLTLPVSVRKVLKSRWRRLCLCRICDQLFDLMICSGSCFGSYSLNKKTKSKRSRKGEYRSGVCKYDISEGYKKCNRGVVRVVRQLPKIAIPKEDRLVGDQFTCSLTKRYQSQHRHKTNIRNHFILPPLIDCQCLSCRSIAFVTAISANETNPSIVSVRTQQGAQKMYQLPSQSLTSWIQEYDSNEEINQHDDIIPVAKRTKYDDGEDKQTPSITRDYNLIRFHEVGATNYISRFSRLFSSLPFCFCNIETMFPSPKILPNDTYIHNAGGILTGDFRGVGCQQVWVLPNPTVMTNQYIHVPARLQNIFSRNSPLHLRSDVWRGLLCDSQLLLAGSAGDDSSGKTNVQASSVEQLWRNIMEFSIPPQQNFERERNFPFLHSFEANKNPTFIRGRRSSVLQSGNSPYARTCLFLNWYNYNRPSSKGLNIPSRRDLTEASQYLLRAYHKEDLTSPNQGNSGVISC